MKKDTEFVDNIGLILSNAMKNLVESHPETAKATIYSM